MKNETLKTLHRKGMPESIADETSVLKWFRDRHNIMLFVELRNTFLIRHRKQYGGLDTKQYNWSYTRNINAEDPVLHRTVTGFDIDEAGEGFDTYEEAMDAGLVRLSELPIEVWNKY